jgi:hypothetical protein
MNTTNSTSREDYQVTSYWLYISKLALGCL